MVYIVANTKGGVGKSTVAVTLATVLSFRNREFKIVELDNNNDSLQFSNSSILTEGRASSLVLKDKTKAIASMIFNIAKNSELSFIIDIGGGDDVKQVIENLKELELEKTFIIPTSSNKKYLKNASDTYEIIDDPDNTIFLLNMVRENNLKDDFIYFFGSEKFGVKPVSSNFKNAKYLSVPYSQFFQIAEDDEQTLLDLALLSINKTESEVTTEFLKEAGDDENKFIKSWEKYEKSKEAAKLFMKIFDNFSKLV